MKSRHDRDTDLADQVLREFDIVRESEIRNVRHHVVGPVGESHLNPASRKTGTMKSRLR
jgi:hypothetical protein